MRGTRLTLAGAALAGALGVAAPAADGASGPTAAQVRRAVRGAERSSGLWATVNICDTTRYPNVIGIRGQMPTLGFAADLRMTFELDYFSQSRQGYLPLRGVAEPVDLGTASRGSYQAGVRFTFGPRTGLLRGRVVFSWRRSDRTIGRTQALTSAGHRGVRYGDPGGYSRDRCVIG